MSIKFRSLPTELSDDEVSSMIKKYDFFNINRNKNGRGFSHKYEVITEYGIVVQDHASNLMWSRYRFAASDHEDAKAKVISDFNRQGWVGYNDWRLPTLEEAMSLMEREKNTTTGYIDPLFGGETGEIWTSDLSKNKSQAWIVHYIQGACYSINIDYLGAYFMIVRSV